MYSVLYTPESEDNFADIFSYISWDNIFYAAKVISSIKSTIDILKLFPLSWRLIDEERRIIIDSNYKYKIVYQVKLNDIYILSVSKYKNSWK